MSNNISAEEAWKETYKNLEYYRSAYTQARADQAKARRIRYILIFSGFFLAVFALLFSIGRPNSILNFFALLLISGAGACFLFFIFFSLFDWLYRKECEDSRHLRNLELQITVAEWRHRKRSFRSLTDDLIQTNPVLAVELFRIIEYDFNEYTEDNATYTPLEACRIIEDFNLRNCRIDGILLPKDYKDAVSSLCTLCDFLYDKDPL